MAKKLYNLFYEKGKKQWRTSYGRTADGKQFRPWVGSNEGIAIQKALKIRDLWNAQPGVYGSKVWAPEPLALAQAIAYGKPQEAAPAPKIAPTPQTVLAQEVHPYQPPVIQQPLRPTDMMLYDLMDIYLAKVNGKRIQEVTKTINASHIQTLKGDRQRPLMKGKQKVFLPNVPISTITVPVIEKWIAALQDRPTFETPGGKEKTISVAYVMDLIERLKAILMFAHEEYFWSYGVKWKGPFHQAKSDVGTLYSDAERVAKDIPVFTLDELSLLYRYSITPWQRVQMLMGLMLGFNNASIATLRKDHIQYKGGEMYIECVRHKEKRFLDNGKPRLNKWWVCPELRLLIEHYLKTTPDNEGNLLLLNGNSGPLIHGHTDNIKLTWIRTMEWMKRKGIPKRPFTMLRKTGGYFIEKVSSHDVVQMFLAHHVGTVAREHYVQSPVEKLFEAQRTMYRELAPMFAQPAISKRGKEEQTAA